MSVPLRLILDTNVVLDLLHFEDAAVLPILKALTTRTAHCYGSVETLDELRRVLAYPEFQLDEAAQKTLYARYQIWVGEPKTLCGHLSMPRCADPDDQMFLELAASTQADWLVSKDKALLALKRFARLGFKIVTPFEASALLGEVSQVKHAVSPPCALESPQTL